MTAQEELSRLTQEIKRIQKRMSAYKKGVEKEDWIEKAKAQRVEMRSEIRELKAEVKRLKQEACWYEKGRECRARVDTMLWLRIQGKTYEEISEITGFSVSICKRDFDSTAYLARKRLWLHTDNEDWLNTSDSKCRRSLR